MRCAHPDGVFEHGGTIAPASHEDGENRAAEHADKADCGKHAVERQNGFSFMRLSPCGARKRLVVMPVRDGVFAD